MNRHYELDTVASLARSIFLCEGIVRGRSRSRGVCKQVSQVKSSQVKSSQCENSKRRRKKRTPKRTPLAYLVGLVQNDIELVVHSSQGVHEDGESFARRSGLVGVKEEEDHVRALPKPPDDSLEVVAAVVVLAI